MYACGCVLVEFIEFGEFNRNVLICWRGDRGKNTIDFGLGYYEYIDRGLIKSAII